MLRLSNSGDKYNGDNSIKSNNRTTPVKSEQVSTQQVIQSFHEMGENIFSYGGNDPPQIEKYDIGKVDIGRIPAEESTQFINNISADNQKIAINYQKRDNIFSFYNLKGDLIGKFSLEDIIKYFGSIYDFKNQFMKYLDPNEYKRAKHMIENFIGKVDLNKKLKYANIELLDYRTSAFMNDIETLVRLNDALYYFDKDNLNKELQYVDKKYRGNIEFVIKQLMYLLLSYTLQLIVIVTDDVKNNEELKEQLIKYSVGVVYRISQFVQNQLSILIKRNEELEKTIEMSTKLRKIMESKIDGLINIIGEQNDLLKNPQSGGSKTKISESSSPNKKSSSSNKKKSSSTESDECAMYDYNSFFSNG